MHTFRTILDWRKTSQHLGVKSEPQFQKWLNSPTKTLMTMGLKFPPQKMMVGSFQSRLKETSLKMAVQCNFGVFTPMIWLTTAGGRDLYGLKGNVWKFDKGIDGIDMILKKTWTTLERTRALVATWWWNVDFEFYQAVIFHWQIGTWKKKHHHRVESMRFGV